MVLIIPRISSLGKSMDSVKQYTDSHMEGTLRTPCLAEVKMQGAGVRGPCRCPGRKANGTKR